MGLFDIFKGKPYKVDSLNMLEKAAVEAALEASITFGLDDKNLDINGALKSFRKGGVNKDELSTIIAVLVVSLAAMQSGDDPDRSSELQKHQVATVSLASALSKLSNMR